MGYFYPTRLITIALITMFVVTSIVSCFIYLEK